MNAKNAIKTANENLLSSRELAIFCEQIAMMLKSGMLIHDGIQMLVNDTSDAKRKNILQNVSDALHQNEPFDQALAASSAFPSYMIHMVSIGSEAGRLDKVMQSLASYYHRQYNLLEMTKSAIVYPSILIAMMLSVLLFLMAKVLPIFQNAFESLGSSLSTSAMSIFEVGQFVRYHSIWLIPVFVVLFIMFWWSIKSHYGKTMWQAWIARRSFSEKFSLSTFASSMALMLSSGLDTEESMKLSLDTIPNHKVKQKVSECIDIVSTQNGSLVDAFQSTRLFSNTTIGMLSIASKSGSIDSAMHYVAELYENEFEASITRKISLIEPTSVAVLSVLIGFVLIAIMFPLLGIMSSIH